MARMTSSLRPRGSVSASMSVTKPCLYSRLASSSIVLVAVLMSVSVFRYSRQRQRDTTRRAQHFFHRGLRREQFCQADPVQHVRDHVAQRPPDRTHGAISRVDAIARRVLGALVAFAVPGVVKQRLAQDGQRLAKTDLVGRTGKRVTTRPATIALHQI